MYVGRKKNVYQKGKTIQLSRMGLKSNIQVLDQSRPNSSTRTPLRNRLNIYQIEPSTVCLSIALDYCRRFGRASGVCDCEFDTVAYSDKISNYRRIHAVRPSWQAYSMIVPFLRNLSGSKREIFKFL